MASFFSEEFSMKISQNDDAASTASGASSDPASPPASPDLSEVNSTSPASTASLAEAVTPSLESLKDLPSVGSLGHFAGLCSRCCFHSKGRCQNGHDCRFCHFDHDKRQRKKKMNVRGYPVAPPHRQLEYWGFHNDAWRSTPQLSHSISAPPGLECKLPCSASPPPPLNSPVVTVPAPAFLAVASPGKIAESAIKTPQSEESLGAREVGKLDSARANNWSVDTVRDWLTSVGLGHMSKNFEEHRITGDILLDLDSSDLEEIGIHALGDKKRLLKAVLQLRTSVLEASCPPPPPTPAPYWQAPLMETTFPWGLCPSPPLPPPPSFDATLI